jgi:hypothetical protein
MIDIQVNGRWHIGDGPYTEADEIDTQWVASGGAWDYEMLTNDFHAYVRDSVPVSYRYVDASTDLEVDVEFQAVTWTNDEDDSENAASFVQQTPTIDDDTLFWEDIATGWDAQVKAQTARLAKVIYIDSLANLGSPTIGGTNIALTLELRFQKSATLDVYIDGVLWDENSEEETSTDIEFRDGATTLFRFRKPFASDQSGDAPATTQRVRRVGANLLVDVRVPWSWLQSASFPIEIDPDIEIGVGAGANDAHEKDNNTTFNSTTTDVNFSSSASDTARYNGGLRFDPINIPPWSTITTSYMKWIGRSVADTDPNCDVFADDEDDSNDFVAEQDVTLRTRTTASTSIPSGTITLNTSTYVNTPSLNSVVQEIVDRANWSTGNALTMLVDGKSDTTIAVRLKTYECDSTEAARLHIEFLPGITVDYSQAGSYLVIS